MYISFIEAGNETKTKGGVMKKLYIVEGESTVDGNDSISWLVCAYDNKEYANAHANLAEKSATDYYNGIVDFNKDDVQMSKVGVTVYNVIECDYAN